MIGFEELHPGRVLGRYELLLPVGRGGMAQVWAARMRGTRGFQKIVAIKVMLPSMMDDAQFEQMFLDEATLASQVRHPHVIEILDLGEDRDVLYLVMEWVDGEPLNVILRHVADGGVPISIAVNVMMQACRGLHAAHELKNESGELVELVHRDISPQNILVSYDGVVKIVDFGVAKATSRVSAETEAGHLKGKVAYMSPEQINGLPIDRRTDIFAMGIVLYMLTTGRHPFKGDNDGATVANITSSFPVPPPSSFVEDYPTNLERIVLRALAKDRERRFTTANELLKALSRALPSTLPVSTDEEVASFIKNLNPDRLVQRKAAIKAALRNVVGEVTGDSRLSSPDAPTEMVIGASRQDTSVTGAGTATLETRSEGLSHRGRRKRLWWAAAGIMAPVVVGGTVLALQVQSLSAPVPDVAEPAGGALASAGRGESDAGPASGAAYSVGGSLADAAPTDAGAPEEDGGAPDAASASADEKAEAETPAKPARRRAPRQEAKPKPERERKPERGSGSAQEPFISPVRDPGF